MSLAIVHSRALDGMQAPPVSVEVHLSGGLPGFTLVGLPDTEVREARDRVRAALLNSGFDFPQKRITVNLAPADLPKESGRFDLPIAVGILAASGQIPQTALDQHELAGELSLSGALRAIRGTLAMLLAAAAGARDFILPLDNGPEAALLQRTRPAGSPDPAAPSAGPANRCLVAASLKAVCDHLSGRQPLAAASADPAQADAAIVAIPDMADVKGQAQARRALEIAACGNHSLILFGPPGSGKSMLAARLPGLLPPLDEAAACDSAAVLSLAGQFRPRQFGQRPFRAPHHTASAVALVGGGNPPRPGEISLAHQGVLFLDELPEFERKVLETLREPLESGHIHIARAARHADFPARFQLVAAMNPCPCGWLGHSNGKCRCTPNEIARYRNRISGPLLDRIDLQVEVPALPAETLQQRGGGEDSAAIRVRVLAARERQQARQGKLNSSLSGAEIDEWCQPDATGKLLLQQAAQRLNLSARAYHRILRVARSIADLAGEAGIGAAQIAEAVQYRRLAQG